VFSDIFIDRVHGDFGGHCIQPLKSVLFHITFHQIQFILLNFKTSGLGQCNASKC
jgi:hypothetical protein